MEDYIQRVVLKDLSQFSKVYVLPLADLHEGARDADHDVSDRYIQWVKDTPEAYTVLNGDLMNCAWKDSMPELFEDLITPDHAYGNLRARLLPIKDKILMITRGGHEESIFRKVGVDFMARLAYDLGDVPYMPDGGMFGIRLSRNNHHVMFWGYCTHGWGGARTIGAKIKKVEDLAEIANVDMVILSHDHTANIHRFNVLDPPRSKIQFKRPMHWNIQRKLLINTGGFVKYAGYVQRKGYMPHDLGTPRIRLEIKIEDHNNYRRDLHASL